MARGLNKVLLIGNLGQDPVMRYTPSGKPVTAFRLAVNRTWIAAEGERREETDWFNIVAWGDLAETCNRYLRKGDRIYLEGRLKERTWETADKQKRSLTEVVAQELLMLDGRQRDTAEAEVNASGDEIPF